MAGHHDDNVFLLSDFDDPMEQIIIPMTTAVREQAELKKGRIDLWVNSYGGMDHVLMHLVELVELAKQNDVVVRTIVPSVAFSAGSMLAITGTPGERYIAPHAHHLIHYGSVGSMESTPTQIERWTKWKDSLFKYTLKHYDTYSAVPNLKEKISDDGYFVKANEAIKWGLADKYTSKFELEP